MADVDDETFYGEPGRVCELIADPTKISTRCRDVPCTLKIRKEYLDSVVDDGEFLILKMRAPVLGKITKRIRQTIGDKLYLMK